MLDEAARAYFDAVAARDPARLRAAIAALVPEIEPAVGSAVARQRALLRRGREDERDVVQRVFEKLITHPPDNPGDRRPAAALLAWAKAVAMNHLLDRARHFQPIEGEGEDEDREGEEEGGEARARAAPVMPSQERAAEQRERWRMACACADTDLARHKHLREVFYLLAEDPDLSARELSARLGLVSAASDREAVRRAEQLVFKLRERVHVKLAECLDRHEIRGARGEGGSRW